MGKIKTLSNSIRCRIEDVDAVLKSQTWMYTMSQMECILCGRAHPAGAKRCRPCNNNTDLRQRYCSSDTRVADYIAILRQQQLWGNAKPLETLSATELVSRVSQAQTLPRHYCNAGRGCPLIMQLHDLASDVCRIRDDVTGLSIEDIQRSG